MAEKLQVFGAYGSPFSCRVELALKLKSLEYEYIQEDLHNKKSDLLLKYNPIHKKVPVLVHDGKPILESLVILEYIEENWKLRYPILSEDPHERAIARFWAKFVDDKFLPALLKAVKTQGEEREKAEEEGREALQALENELKSKRFFGGDRIGFVDIVAIVVAYWAPAMEEGFGLELLSSGKFPKLSQWSEELISQSVVKENLPPKHELIAHLQAVFNKIKNLAAVSAIPTSGH